MPEDGSDEGLDAGVPDGRIAEMVAELRPAWAIESIHRIDEGTDFVAALDVRARDGDARRVVLKATTAGLVDPPVARAEPRLLRLVGEATSIPVPSVYGACDRHDDLPAPFTLLEYVDGDVFENRVDELSTAQRERICRDAGRNLAALHDLGPLPAAGTVGVADGDLAVLDTDDHPRFDDSRDWLLADCLAAIDALETGGWFPDLADDPERFADLVPELRAHVHETVPALPVPDPPTYAHVDYRYGNLLVDPSTGATNAVLDWANLSATPPAYNLANAESLLLRPDRDPAAVTETLREAFRSAYAAERPGWQFDDAAQAWLDVSHFVNRLGAMGCLPLWHEDATPEERDERAAEHRAFVREYL